MNIEAQVLALFEEGNPVPDLDGLEPIDIDAAAYLATLEQRSDEMTQVDTKPVEEEKPKRRRLILVLSTAAAAILIGAVLILTQSEEAPPPATEPTPTTIAEVTPTTIVEQTPTTVPEVLDPQVEEGLSVATAFTEALIVGDLAAAESHALDSVALFLVDGGFSPGIGPSGEVPWKDALGWEATLNECIVTSPDPVDTRVTCSITNSTDISRALGVSPYTSLHHYTVMYEGGTYFGQTINDTLVVDDGGDADTWERVGYEEFKAGAFDPFMAWLEANHLDDLEGVMWYAFSIGVFSPDRWLTGDFGPDHSPESVELWRQYSEEFIAEQTG